MIVPAKKIRFKPVRENPVFSLLRDTYTSESIIRHRAANQSEYAGLSKEQTLKIAGKVSNKWEKLNSEERTERKYKRIVRTVKTPVITAVKNGVNKTATFTGAYNGNYDSRFLDGINPGGGGGGGDLSSQQLYIGVPSFLAPNSTLATNAGFTVWPWDPRTKTHTTPSEWPSAESVGNYYVDNSHPSATDTANDYGYPDQPRLTLPTMTNLPAGTLVQVGGGTISLINELLLSGSRGTAENPIFIRGPEGVSEANMPQISGDPVKFENSSYIIFENFKWDGGNTTNQVMGTAWNGAGSTDHIVIRNNLIKNLDYIAGGSALISIGADDRNGGNVTSDIVVYNNTAENCGTNFDWTAQDGDQAMVSTTTRINEGGAANLVHTTRVWVIDNTANTISGNFFQSISLGTPEKDWRDRVNYVWVAGNYHTSSRQGGYWSKRASHIIFSQNTSTDNQDYAAGNGQAAGCQYGPDELWFIGNLLTNSVFGIQQTDTGAEASAAEYGNLYCVGNIIANLFAPTSSSFDQTGSFRPETALSFTYHGNMNRYVVLNTVYKAVNAIVGDASNGKIQSASNVFMLQDGSFVNPSTGVNQGNFYQGGSADTISARNDQCYRLNGTWKSYINGSNYTNVDNVNALPNFSNLLNTNPLLTDPANADYLPGLGSPVLNTGVWTTPDGTDVRSVFLANYGLDIDYDFNQTERSASQPDRGAIEAA